MKQSFLLALSALVVAHTSPADALDCAKASQPVEKMFCDTPKLKKADEAMSAAYFKLLRQTTDPEFHEALIRSQRRWLEARSHGAERFGAAEGDDTDDRTVLLQMTNDRMTFLRSTEPIRTMQEQRTIAVKESGGRFAGYASYCSFLPPPYGNWNYACWGTVYRQHHDRICSLGMEWASGHMTEYRLISILKSGKPTPIASCSTGYASTSEQCPDADDDAETKAIAHWNTTPEPSDGRLPPQPNGLWKYDPDIESRTVDQPWMSECLFAPTYPPPEVSRPNTSSQK